MSDVFAWMHLRRHLALVTLLVPGACLFAAETSSAPDEQIVEVVFKNGDATRGVVVSKTADELVLRVTVTSKGSKVSTEQTYPMRQVNSITTLADEYRQRAANTPNQAPDQADLARWCLEHGLPDEARGHALKAYDAEPVNHDALEILHRLGQVRIDNAWQDIDAWLATKQLVRFDGLVCDAATREQLKKLAAQRTTDATALTTTKQQIDQLTSLAATAKERQTRIDQERKEADSAAATADSRQKAVDAAHKAVTAAAEQIKKASEVPQGNQNQKKRNEGAVANAEAAKRKADDALTAAQKELAAADPASAKAHKARLDADAAKAKADAERVSKELPVAQAALPAKQTTADASAKAYADARAAITLPADLPQTVKDFLAADQLPTKR